MSHEEFLNENCNLCGRNFVNIEDVFVDIESDTYVCLKCVRKYKIKVVKCLEYSEEEE